MKQATRKTMTRVISITMAVLMVIGMAWTGISALSTSGSSAEILYPPLLRYEDSFYMLTSEQTEASDGEAQELQARVIGDQQTLPTENGTCNFGSGTMVFRLEADGQMLCQDNDGNWLICEKLVSDGEE